MFHLSVWFCVTEMCFFSFFTIFFIISGGFWQCRVFSFLSANPEKTTDKVLICLSVLPDVPALHVAEVEVTNHQVTNKKKVVEVIS